jgi:DNA end-binding protein Ku
MGAQSRASAVVRFGEWRIPVRLYAMTDPESTRAFHLVHHGCGSRLRSQYVCAADGAVVPVEQRAKAYELTKGEHVTFTPGEIEAIQSEDDGLIQVSEYMPLEAIDPLYYDERADYLEPADDGAAYLVMVWALTMAGLVAVGQYTSRGRQRIVLLRPLPHGLGMQHLRYLDDVREPPKLKHGAESKRDDFDAALDLIQRHSRKTFDPGRYKDHARDRLHAQALRKAAAGRGGA